MDAVTSVCPAQISTAKTRGWGATSHCSHLCALPMGATEEWRADALRRSLASDLHLIWCEPQRSRRRPCNRLDRPRRRCIYRVPAHARAQEVLDLVRLWLLATRRLSEFVVYESLAASWADEVPVHRDTIERVSLSPSRVDLWLVTQMSDRDAPRCPTPWGGSFALRRGYKCVAPMTARLLDPGSQAGRADSSDRRNAVTDAVGW